MLGVLVNDNTFCSVFCHVYEIYPQSKTPQLTLIQATRPPFAQRRAQLLPNRVVWHELHPDRIIVAVWDYRLNHSVRFSGDIENLNHYEQVGSDLSNIFYLLTRWSGR